MVQHRRDRYRTQRSRRSRDRLRWSPVLGPSSSSCYLSAIDLVIAPDDPRAADVRTLLDRHLTFAREVTPPEDVFALDVEGLLDPAVTLFGGRLGGTLKGIGALKHLDKSHGELKSMHTLEEARGLGVGRAIIDHILSVALDRGYDRVSLETGRQEAFGPARSFYTKVGFVPCEPFGEYVGSTSSACMTLNLDR